MLGAPKNPEYVIDHEPNNFDSAINRVANSLMEALQGAGVSTKKYPDLYVLKNWISLNGSEELWKVRLVIETGDFEGIDFADHERFIASLEREISRITETRTTEELREIELGQVASTRDDSVIAS